MISRKQNSSNHMSSPLEQVETFKYLGVLLSSDLSWSSHIDFICTKAHWSDGNVDNHSLLELYSVLVRSHLEYAAPIWDPHFIKDTNKLESVQRFALKMCLKQWDLGYQDLLDLSQLPNLENRRLYLKLCTLYKNYTLLLLLSLQCIPHVNRHSYSLPSIHQPCAHTNAFQSSFVPSSVSVWNQISPLKYQLRTAHALPVAEVFLQLL